MDVRKYHPAFGSYIDLGVSLGSQTVVIGSNIKTKTMWVIHPELAEEIGGKIPRREACSVVLSLGE